MNHDVLPHVRSRKAFTLIELLVVIAIIGILMALLFPAIKGILDSAARTQARTQITGIVAAVKHYYSDYGQYPILTTGAAAATATDVSYGKVNGGVGTQPNAELFNILRNLTAGGTGTTGNTQNPRGVVYFEAPDVKKPSDPRNGFVPYPGAGVTPASNGASGNPVAAGSLVDPWGSEYIVLLDASYDNRIKFSDTKVNYKDQGTYLPTGVGAVSVGKDGVLGAKVGGTGNNNFTNSDDIVSWH
jgi:prepilin-type N-terminal cleavage/methylation domain-containing protein